MTPNLSQQAKGVMSHIDGSVHRQATRYAQATIPKNLQNLISF